MPTSLVSRKAGLSPAKQALLEKYMHGAMTNSEGPSLSPAPYGSKVPLSYAQQRLWFIDQLEPGSVAYNVPLAVRLRGDLKAAAVKKSLEKIVARHEVLRTRFAVHQGQPVQVIETQAEIGWKQWDVTDRNRDERERQAQKLAAE